MTSPTDADILAATPAHLRDAVAWELQAVKRARVMQRDDLIEWNTARCIADFEAALRHEEIQE